jgi:O-antigen/teichoic acid export membrane protein
MPTKKLSIFSNFIYLFSSRVTIRIFTFVFTIAFARILGPEKLGIYSFSLSLAGVCLVLVDLGIGQVILRDLSANLQKEWPKLCLGITTKLVLIPFGIFVYTLILNSLGYGSSDFLLPMIILGASRFIQTLDTIIGNAFIAAERMDLKFIITVTNHLMVSLGGTVLIILKFDLPQLSTWILITSLLSFLLSFYLASSHLMSIRLKVSICDSYQLIRESWPYGAGTILERINTNIDGIIIGNILGMEVNGIYTIGRRVYRILLVIPSMIKTVFFPSMSRLYHNNTIQFKALYSTLFRTVGIIGLLTLLLSCLFIEDIIGILFGAKYFDAIPIVLVFSLVTCVVNWQHIVGSSLLITKNRKAYSLPIFMGAISNIVLSLYLIFPLGSLGVAWASLASSWIILIGWIIMGKRHDGLIPDNLSPLILLQLICTVAIFLKVHFNTLNGLTPLIVGIATAIWFCIVLFKGDYSIIKKRLFETG